MANCSQLRRPTVEKNIILKGIIKILRSKINFILTEFVSVLVSFENGTEHAS